MPHCRRLQKRHHGVDHLAIAIGLRQKRALLGEMRSHGGSDRIAAGVEHGNSVREPADFQPAFKLVVQIDVGEDQVERLIGLGATRASTARRFSSQ